MTASDTADAGGDGMVCSEDGVVVRVRPREARGEVPAYEYVVHSERHGPVTVRLRQPVPEDVDEADLGFPTACEDDWRVVAGDLVAELPLEPDERVRTVWGVREEDHPDVDPPTIDVRAGGRDEDEESAAEAPQEGTLDLDDPGTAEPPAGAGSIDDGSVADVGGVGAESGGLGADSGELGAESGTGAAGSPPASAAAGDSLVARLLREIESGTVDERQRAALADALELQGSESANAFVEHVQGKVERRTDRMERELESIEESVDQLYGVKADASELSTIKRGLAELDDGKVSTGELRDLRDRVDELESGLGGLAGRLESTPDQEAVEAVADRLEELEDALEELRADVSDLADRHEELVDDHAGLADSAATGEDLEDVREAHRGELNATRSEVADLQSALEDDYPSADEVHDEIDRRLNRGVATLALFGAGVAGLVATVPLARQGAPAAAATVLGAAASLAAWQHVLRSEGGLLAGVPLLGRLAG